MNKLQRQQQGTKIRLSVKYSDPIRQALINSVDVKQIVEDFIISFQTVEVTPQQARTWAFLHIQPKTNDLDKIIKRLHAESYILGDDIALSAIAKVVINKAPTLKDFQRAQGINWDTWKPGNRAASALLKPPNGLKKLMTSRNVTIKGISKTTVDRIGTQLAYALQHGLSPSSTTLAIMDLLGKPSPERTAYLVQQGYKEIDVMLRDPERALMIAQTEMSRAVSVASREMYQDTGVELVEWLTADPCDECQENEDVSPIGIDETFPSGDTEPPAHPNCACALSPYTIDTRGLGEEALSLLLNE